MTIVTQIDKQSFRANEGMGSHDQLDHVFHPIFTEFDGILHRYVAFNLFFIVLCTLEVLFLGVFFSFLSKSLVLALGLALLFFTCFAYFTFRIYFQTKKPEQLKGIKDRYIETCREMISSQESSEKQSLALASAYCKLANRLHAREYTYYQLPKWLGSLFPWIERFSCWWHWQDVHFMKELLLQEAVNEQIKLVKCCPTSLEAHASLANAYVMLSGLYIDPRKLEGYDDEYWIPSDKYDEEFAVKFRTIAERAIEEFKVLCEYAPDDPWVHSQLAYSYHDLQMPKEEIAEYETIQKLLPDDKDNLYKLGKLYFQQGMNAKGLRAYEELKKAHYSKAENLIKYYGSNSTS